MDRNLFVDCLRNNLQGLFEEKTTFLLDRMFVCEKYQIKFHPRYDKLENNGKVTDETISWCKKELLDRVSYLKEKFINLQQSDHNIIFFLKVYATNFDEDRDYIFGVYEAVKERFQSFKLVVIVSDKGLEKYLNQKEYQNLYVRRLQKFANKKRTNITGDIHGWCKILNEFYVEKSNVYYRNLWKRRKNGFMRYCLNASILQTGFIIMINQRAIKKNILSISIPKNMTLVLYFLTMLILLLDMTDNFPGTSVLRKIKYILIILMAFDYVADGVLRLKKDDLVIFGGLLLHTVLFGFVFVNETIANDTYTHCREMLIYLSFLYFTVNMIRKYNCRFQFIKVTSWAFAIFLTWTGVTHFGNFVNPVYFIYVLSRTDRYRGEFGTSSPNYIGYICLIAIIFILMLLQEYKHRGELSQSRMIVWGLVLVWTFCILMSSASRSSVLSLAIIIALGVAQYLYKRNRQLIIYFGIILAVVVIAFLILNRSSIWGNSNRDANISVNYEAFKEIGNWLTGMGYIESSGFYAGLYAYKTFALDIYYAYIFFSTGIIGIIIIAVVLLYILQKLLFRKNIPDQFFLVSVYLALLFDGMWQVNILTYRYAPTVCIFALLIVSIGERGSLKQGVEKKDWDT